RPPRAVAPGVAVEALEQPAEQDRLPLGLRQAGLAEDTADPLGGQVRIGGAEVEVEDRPALGAQAWIAQPSTARAASRIASEIVGCGCGISASSWYPPPSAITPASSAIQPQA